jgi:tRNA dimethylallyltransferase
MHRKFEVTNNKILVILGPTASGKSNLAIKLAREFNGEIISADSRQIYRGMDIGTGKVTKKEQTMAKHHLLDIVSPNSKYNIAKFKKQAEKIIQDILKRGKMPIICGGTAFWIEAIVKDVNFPAVKPNWELRKKLAKKSATTLLKMLQKLDSERAKNIEPQNKVRLIRAIEICKAIGKVPSNKYQMPNAKYQFIQIGITWQRNILQKRIKLRLDKRLKQGMLKEVKYLHFKEKISWKRLESFGLEYRWISRYLQNKISKAEMEEKLYFDIIHYAKRQMTWLQKDKNIIWTKNYSTIKNKVKNFTKN